MSVVRKCALAEDLVEQVEPLAHGWKRRKRKKPAPTVLPKCLSSVTENPLRFQVCYLSIAPLGEHAHMWTFVGCSRSQR